MTFRTHGAMTFHLKSLFDSTLICFLSAQALSCYSCPTGTTFTDCATDHESKKCSEEIKHCITIKTFVEKSRSEQVLYLEKDCGLAVACQSDPTVLVCNMKNQSYIGQGNKMLNCTSRCCATDRCNDDDLPLLPSSSKPSPSATTTVVPGSLQTGDTLTTAKPTGCGSESSHLPLRMSIVFAGILQLALLNFDVM